MISLNVLNLFASVTYILCTFFMLSFDFLEWLYFYSTLLSVFFFFFFFLLILFNVMNLTNITKVPVLDLRWIVLLFYIPFHFYAIFQAGTVPFYISLVPPNSTSIQINTLQLIRP